MYCTMNNEKKEKLIELVRQHECLYNMKHKQYKNNHFKAMLWDKIGAHIGTTGIKAKDRWRSLRDGYIRHKRAARDHRASSHKYTNFSWSAEMTFLDSTIEMKHKEIDVEDMAIEVSAIKQSLSPVQSRSSSPPMVQTAPAWLYLDPLDSSPSLSETRDFNSLPQQSFTNILQSMPSNIKQEYSLGENGERVLDCHKIKTEWDSVDHLFMSYADTFKKLSVPNQAKLKVELAKLFAEAELKEFENNSTS